MSDADTKSGARARMRIESRPLWRLRLGPRLSRTLLFAGAAAGALACARVAVAPPRPHVTVAPRQRSHASEPAAVGFASLFARAYLSWREDDPEARRRSLEPFVGDALAVEAGAEPPVRGSQRVIWDEVVQERELNPSLHVYTVAAEVASTAAATSANATAASGSVATSLLYLTVSVLTRPNGRLALASYPAFVGPPASTGADPVALAGAEVVDPSLETVLTRALRNYLAPASSELAADLVAGANVSTPSVGLRLESMQRLTWASSGGAIAAELAPRGGARTVVAQIDAVGENGARYTLAYEVEVERVSGRWEVAAIETDPDA